MYDQVLLPVDLNDLEHQQKSIQTAVQFARDYGATIHLMNVVPDFGMSIVSSFFPEGFEEKALAEAHDKLKALATEVIPAEISLRTAVAHGSIYSQILDYAKQEKIGVIVMASHRPGFEDYLLGPNAARVVRHATCSVMVVRE